MLATQIICTYLTHNKNTPALNELQKNTERFCFTFYINQFIVIVKNCIEYFI